MKKKKTWPLKRETRSLSKNKNLTS